MHTPGEIGVCFSNKKAPVARFRPTVEGREGGSVPGARARLVAAGRLVVGRARRQLHRRERHAGRRRGRPQAAQAGAVAARGQVRRRRVHLQRQLVHALQEAGVARRDVVRERVSA